VLEKYHWVGAAPGGIRHLLAHICLIGGGEVKSSGESTDSEARRLEELWSGSFGTAYAQRNDPTTFDRSPFWETLLKTYPAERILEVGCNTGANLYAIAATRGPSELVGVDVSQEALRQLRVNLPEVDALFARARELPFRDGWFDLAFTTGVLIHQPDESLRLVMSELVRVSRRYVLCGEYYAADRLEVDYRGERGALFKRDYGRIYVEEFPELRVVERGFLARADGWDDVTWWLLEKTA
jgi:pseudaminic acid biosynthesis-associated methylase